MRGLKQTIAGLVLGISCLPAIADDFGIDIRAFPDAMGKTFNEIGDHTRISLSECLPGGADKRTVCTYKVGGYMVAMAAGARGEDKLSDLTLVCAAQTDLDGLKCITAYGVAIATMTPDVPVEDRGKIIKALFTAVDAGESVQVKRNGRRYVLHRVVGSLWFHIELDDD